MSGEFLLGHPNEEGGASSASARLVPSPASQLQLRPILDDLYRIRKVCARGQHWENERKSTPSFKRELAAMEVMGVMANCMLSQSGEYCPTLTPKGSIPHPNAQRGGSAPTGCGGRRLILAPYISWHVQVRWAGETPSRVDIHIYIYLFIYIYINM